MRVYLAFLIVLNGIVLPHLAYCQNEKELDCKSQSNSVATKVQNLWAGIKDLLKPDDRQDHEFYLSELKKSEEGSETSCQSAEGIFRSQEKPVSELTVHRPAEEMIKSVGVPREISQIYIYEVNLEKGILAHSSLGWIRYTTAKKNLFNPGQPLTDAQLLIAWREKPETFFKHSMTLYDNSEEILFEDAGTKVHFVFDGKKTIQEFSKKTPHDLAHVESFINNPNIRIPVEMYELLENQSFIVARSAGNFTLMFDLIYQQALKTMNGNTFDALLVSLATTDLRNRGPCGARHGLRGRLLVPRSIFNFEKSTVVEPSRLDAAQHFFGYALLTQLTASAADESIGVTASKMVSFLSKEKDYYMPGLTNFFQRFHGLNDSESVSQPRKGDARITYMTGKTFLAERRRIDIKRDMYYNELGVRFALDQSQHTNARPSEVINDPKTRIERYKLGIASPKIRSEWAAFDPNRAPIIVYNRGLAQTSERALKIKIDIVQIVNGDSLLFACKEMWESICYNYGYPPPPLFGKPPTNDTRPLMKEEELMKLKLWCEESSASSSNYTIDACLAYKYEMQRHVNSISQ